MKNKNEIESDVKEWLEQIKPVPPRNPQMASRGRAQFLGMAVSASKLPRQKGWISIFRKERYAMNVLLSILVIAGLLFGGGATAVGAAQDDLPNEPLYGLKTWTEDFTLQFQNDGEEKANHLMELAQIRIREMVQLSEGDKPIPDEVPLRLEQHIRQAMQISINMDDAALDQTILQLRERLQEQERVLEQLQAKANPDIEPILLRTRAMLQLRIQLLDEGLQNREMFRNTVRNGQEDEFAPPVQNGEGQQIGEPNSDPNGPNTEPNGPNIDPNGPNTDPNGPANGSGDPNTNPDGNENDNDAGNGGSNDSGSGGGSNDNGSGGSGKP